MSSSLPLVPAGTAGRNILRYTVWTTVEPWFGFGAGETDDSLLKVVQTGIGAQHHVQWVLGGGSALPLPRR